MFTPQYKPEMKPSGIPSTRPPVVGAELPVFNSAAFEWTGDPAANYSTELNGKKISFSVNGQVFRHQWVVNGTPSDPAYTATSWGESSFTMGTLLGNLKDYINLMSYPPNATAYAQEDYTEGFQKLLLFDLTDGSIDWIETDFPENIMKVTLYPFPAGGAYNSLIISLTNTAVGSAILREKIRLVVSGHDCTFQFVDNFGDEDAGMYPVPLFTTYDAYSIVNTLNSALQSSLGNNVMGPDSGLYTNAHFGVAYIYYCGAAKDYVVAIPAIEGDLHIVQASSPALWNLVLT